MSTPAKILVVRTDKLGDFMLSYPAFAMLKDSLPAIELHALVQAYTRPMAELCSSIDKVMVDPEPDGGITNVMRLARELRKEHYDAVITLFSTTRIGLAVALAGIPYRLAPATKIAQLFYNRRLKQRRSQSAKPEFIYNRDLAEFFLKDRKINIAVYPEAPYLSFDSQEVSGLKTGFLAQHNIEPQKKLVFIHPGSGGSANNLSVEQYARLAQSVEDKENWQLVISAGPGEEKPAKLLAELTKDLSPVIYISAAGLTQFAKHLAFADIFISGSTGPLHIAGALDRATAAFYTRRRSATSLRWQTLSADKHRLAFSPAENAEQEDMQSVDVAAAARQISEQLL